MKSVLRAWRRALVVAALAVAFAATAALVSADLGGFTIADFHSDLTVEQDSDLVVAERITVDFSEPRHGIYRTIPVRYTDPHGYGYSIGFRLLGVEDADGNAVVTDVSGDGPRVKIRLGDADRYVDGRQVYVIRYRVRGAVKSFTDHDELYWNAVGDEWPTTIQRASATVYLPGEVPPDQIEASAYTGQFGSRATDAEVDVPEAGTATYTTDAPLGPREAMTVVAAWPKGYVDFPGPLSEAWRLLLDNWIVAAPLAALGLMWRRYRTRGLDPAGAVSVMVQYTPPEGLTAGEIGALVDEKVDLRDITATVVDLAIRGHLTIGQEEQKGLFRSTSVPSFARQAKTEALQPHEQRSLDALFATGDNVTATDLREQFYVNLPAIKSDIFERLVSGGYFADNPESVRNRYLASAFIAGGLTIAVGAAWSFLRGGIMPLALIVPVIAGVLVTVCLLAFVPAMPRRTESGVRMRNWALGFQEFVNRVEADRIARDERRGVFESLLPYAMALGVAAVWARKFEGIYEAAPPPWYVGVYPHGVFSTTGLEHDLSSAMASTAAVMAETPRSSGSSGAGGGGFSGGGFGGGGGGSW